MYGQFSCKHVSHGAPFKVLQQLLNSMLHASKILIVAKTGTQIQSMDSWLLRINFPRVKIKDRTFLVLLSDSLNGPAAQLIRV